MITFIIEDPTGKVSVILFPKTFSQYGTNLTEDMLVTLSGKLDDKRGQFQIICDSLKILSIETMIANAKEAGLYDENDKGVSVVSLLDDILREDEVDIPPLPAVDDKAVNAVEDFNLDGESVDKSFTIHIPDGVDAGLLKEVKELLMQNRGDTEVELLFGTAKQKIKLPFTVNITEKLKADIDSLLIAN